MFLAMLPPRMVQMRLVQVRVHLPPDRQESTLQALILAATRRVGQQARQGQPEKGQLAAVQIQAKERPVLVILAAPLVMVRAVFA